MSEPIKDQRLKIATELIASNYQGLILDNDDTNMIRRIDQALTVAQAMIDRNEIYQKGTRKSMNIADF
jgi:hypothetical protein